MADEKRRKKILKGGKTEISVMHSGMRQKFEFNIIREETPVGKVPVLKVDRWINVSELLRIAESLDLPVEGPAGRFFPKGKKAIDYAGM
ncbi:MAG: hypothetical protein ABIH83_01595 [Candidatus Micrarchaeota archaeon]